MASVTPDTITALPIPPSTNDPENFDPRADAFLGALPDLVTEVNTVADQTYQNALTSEASADAAAVSETNALASEISAANSSTSSANSAGAVVWTNIAYTIGAVRWSPITGLIYRRLTNGTSNTDPSNDTTNWMLISIAAPPVIIITGNTTAVRYRDYILAGSAGITLTAPTNPVVGDYFWIRCINSRLNNYVDFGSAKLMGSTDSLLQVDLKNTKLFFRYISTEFGWSI